MKLKLKEPNDMCNVWEFSHWLRKFWFLFRNRRRGTLHKSIKTIIDQNFGCNLRNERWRNFNANILHSSAHHFMNHQLKQLVIMINRKTWFKINFFLCYPIIFGYFFYHEILWCTSFYVHAKLILQRNIPTCEMFTSLFDLSNEIFTVRYETHVPTH